MKTLLQIITLMLIVCALVACKERGDTDTSSASVSLETPDSFLRFLNDQDGNVFSQEWSEAYYYVVDPFNERRTLEAWKQKNGFGGCDDEFNIVFRDSKDLGYGRDMYACQYDIGSSAFPEGRFSVFVRNFIVQVADGDPSNYGPINVEAAIENDTRHHIGTNAIEFSPIDPSDPMSEKVTKFFTFTPSGQLNLSADLDGRGSKPMPQPCLLCHGATLQPWNAKQVLADSQPWKIPEVERALRTAKMNPLEIETFDYSSLYSLWSRSNQEERFRRFNHHVLTTYVETANRDDTRPEHWCADFAIELALGRYDPSLSPAAPATSCDDYVMAALSGDYQEQFVPRGWKEDVSRPEGVEVLYKRVIEPHCISCHALRGNAPGVRAAESDPDRRGNAINFASYEDFIGYSDLITEYVFRRGVMPLSLRNYLDFWENPNDAPAILASYLPGFDLYNSAGQVVAPGRPVAIAGTDRTVVVSPVELDASASLFSASYQWSVVSQPVSSNASLSSQSSVTTVMTADMDGEYVIRLTVFNTLGSDTDEFTVTVDASLLPIQSELNFYDDIRPILQDADAILGTTKREACVNCHVSSVALSPANANRGIPVYYDDAVDNPFTHYDRNLYEDVLARVDLDEPENSILLLKSTRAQHGGGVVIDLDEPGHQQTYNTILNWIRAGAPCDNSNADGVSAQLCPFP